MAVRYELHVEERMCKELVSTVQIRIYSYKDRVARGVVMFLQDRREIPFGSLDQALLIIEELLDRSLEAAPDYRYLEARGSNEGWLDAPITFPSKGSPQSFLVRVYGRQNRSLQGEIRTGDRRCCFRSGMELMRLIHQSLQKKYKTRISVTGGDLYVESTKK